MLSCILQPEQQVVKRLSASDVIHEKGASSATIVAPGYTLVRLLSGSVPAQSFESLESKRLTGALSLPYLELNVLIAQLHYSGPELDAYCLEKEEIAATPIYIVQGREV